MSRLTDEQTTELLEFVQRLADNVDPAGVPAGGFDKWGSPLDANGDHFVLTDFNHGEDYADFISAVDLNRQAFRAQELLERLGLSSTEKDE